MFEIKENRIFSQGLLQMSLSSCACGGRISNPVGSGKPAHGPEVAGETIGIEVYETYYPGVTYRQLEKGTVAGFLLSCPKLLKHQDTDITGRIQKFSNDQIQNPVSKFQVRRSS